MDLQKISLHFSQIMAGVVLGILFFILEFCIYRVIVFFSTYTILVYILHGIHGIFLFFLIFLIVYSTIRELKKRTNTRTNRFLVNTSFFIVICCTIWYFWL